METTPPLFAPITVPDEQAGQAVRETLAGAATPGASLGRLGEVAAWVAACQGATPPAPLRRPRVVVFAGDHGVAKRGISALDPSSSVHQAADIAAGGGAVNVFARAAGASVRLVDVSLDHDVAGEERVSRSCGAIDVEDAMTRGELDRALAIGKAVADQEIDAGADLLVPGDLGVGNTTVAAAVIGSFTRTEPVAVIGPGSGITDEVWKVKVSALRDAMFRARSMTGRPLEVLQTISSPDFAALVAFIAQAAVRRTPVLLDGAPVTAAAYVAEKLAPGARAWFAAGQLTPEPAHLIALQALELTPLLALDMRVGQGTGALAALPLLSVAVELVADEFAARAEERAQSGSHRYEG
ncbi:nicotinate-nucleotide--dimethylbenzimidazole phosphoribosyltransferase [Corynebacterium halotolerans]|uniref:Nicotinate-nucleotide--dimethylbenzimidazole phosphoribosyltransferase n=1 Tax=Corynebacterium halotolerans YIM 70093 = DSM 44683 TaxID=1121362 RepID=M1NTY4_9CORY|nr:nicotinate-nucleotide--dimethylbenzimidazole phosphoribosyltransferase [Corynebacterium halotolerans]AGF72932.1 nicotinate-nucleotide--dimethylbenzimidazole phosphoribosyltransferase [Corynebacterium halotolerans YIM 70093 = DSM 44683]